MTADVVEGVVAADTAPVVNRAKLENMDVTLLATLEVVDVTTETGIVVLVPDGILFSCLGGKATIVGVINGWVVVEYCREFNVSVGTNV